MLWSLHVGDVLTGVLRMSSPGQGQEGRRPGVMIPTPQYPLYSASLAEYNMEQVTRVADPNSFDTDLDPAF